MPLSRGKDKSLRNHRHTRTLEQYPIVRFYQLLHEVTELLHEVTRLCNPLGKPAIDSNAPLRPSSVSGSLSGWRRSPSISIKVVSFVPKRQPARGVVARCGGETRRASHERGHHQPAMTGGGGGPAKATSSALHVLEQVVMGTLSEMSASNLVTVTATLTPGVTALTQGRPQIK